MVEVPQAVKEPIDHEQFGPPSDGPDYGTGDGGTYR